jgi:hypothetical protein
MRHLHQLSAAKPGATDPLLPARRRAPFSQSHHHQVVSARGIVQHAAMLALKASLKSNTVLGRPDSAYATPTREA